MCVWARAHEGVTYLRTLCDAKQSLRDQKSKQTFFPLKKKKRMEKRHISVSLYMQTTALPIHKLSTTYNQLQNAVNLHLRIFLPAYEVRTLQVCAGVPEGVTYAWTCRNTNRNPNYRQVLTYMWLPPWKSKTKWERVCVYAYIRQNYELTTSVRHQP